MSEYLYPFYDDKGKVICQMCGKSYLVITPMHLKKIHNNMKHEEYKERFPDAPLAGQEFIKRAKFGRYEIFEPDPKPKEDKELELDPHLMVYEDDDLEPEIEELDLQPLYGITEVNLNPMEKAKSKILQLLRLYFPKVEQDYLVMQYRDRDNKLEFQFITDFCDPKQKIVFDFPDTFWHNREAHIDLNRDTKLKNYGWTILKFKSNSPNEKQIESVIRDL